MLDEILEGGAEMIAIKRCKRQLTLVRVAMYVNIALLVLAIFITWYDGNKAELTGVYVATIFPAGGALLVWLSYRKPFAAFIVFTVLFAIFSGLFTLGFIAMQEKGETVTGVYNDHTIEYCLVGYMYLMTLISGYGMWAGRRYNVNTKKLGYVGEN